MNKITKQEPKKDEVSTFISQAIEKNISPEAMEKLFALYEKVKIEKAKEGFVVALTEFQKAIPIIKKTKQVMNKDGLTVRYSYAPIDSVIEQIRKPLADNGFSYTWDSSREEQHIKVVCKLTHLLGHTEKSSFDVPIVESNFMSSPQSYATAQSFAKRYTLLNVLGIGTAEDDNDNQDMISDEDVKSQKSKIIFLLRGLDKETKTKQQIAEGVEKLTQMDLEEKNYQEIINRLEIEIAQRQGL